MKKPPKSLRYNRNRKIADSVDHARLLEIAQSVCYTGNPVHKKNPGDYNLSPPSNPLPHKSLCDKTGVFTKSTALKILRESVIRGLISDQMRGGFPAIIWGVANGIAVEARLDNEQLGTYHAYPMQEGDPFSTHIVNLWNQNEQPTD